VAVWKNLVLALMMQAVFELFRDSGFSSMERFLEEKVLAS
jgi:hypothetical protein